MPTNFCFAELIFNIFGYSALDGLFVCCFDFVALCINHVGPYVEKTNHKIFLNIMKRRVKKDDDEEEPKDKVE